MAARRLGLAALLVAGGAGGSQAQTVAPPWQLAAALGLNQAPLVRAMTTDAVGNVYLVGFFYDSLRLGALPGCYSAGGYRDGFVAKWNAATTSFEWVAQVRGPENEEITAVAVEGGSIYIVGVFNSAQARLGRLSLADQVSTGSTKAFVAKLTPTGASPDFIWAQTLGGEDALVGSVAVQGNNVYVGGSFYGSASFGSTRLPDCHRGQLGSLNGFVAKLTDAGPTARCEWALPAGVGVGQLAVGDQGVYAAGPYNGTLAEFGSVTLSSHGAGNIFVAKLTDAGSTGSLSWIQHTGDIEGVWLQALVVRGSSVYIGGSFFSKTLRFGATSLTNARHGGGTDMFVAKLTDAGSTGSFVWAQRAGGQGYDECTGLAVNETGLYLTGNFNVAPADFGSTRLPNAGSADLCVAQLRDAGPTASFTWAQSLGGPASDAAWAVVVSGAHVYVAGHLVTPVRVGTSPRVQNTFLGVLVAPSPGAGLPPGSSALGLYPNPAQASVWLELPPLPGVEQAALTLYDTWGRVVRRCTLPLTGRPHSWSLYGVAKGVYMLRVKAGATSTGQRLVVE